MTEPPTRGRFSVALAVFVDLLPIVGIIGFGWNLLPILVFYWVEAVVYIGRSSFEALLARFSVDDDYYGMYIPLEELREKRGSVRVVDWLPPIYPRNVPFALNGGLLVVVLGAVAVLVMLFARPPITFEPNIFLAVSVGAVLVLGRETAMLHESLRLERYKAHSALSTFSRRRWMTVLIFAFVILLPGASRLGNIGFGVTLVLVVTAKLYYDIQDARTPADAPEHRDDTVPTQDIVIPSSDPIAVGETDRRGVVLEAVLFGPLFALAPPSGLAIVLLSLAAVMAFDLTIAGAIFVGLLGLSKNKARTSGLDPEGVAERSAAANQNLRFW